MITAAARHLALLPGVAQGRCYRPPLSPGPTVLGRIVHACHSCESWPGEVWSLSDILKEGHP